MKEQLLLDTQQQKFSLLQQFKTLSDLPYTSIELPEFKLVDEAEFIKRNLELQSTKAQKVQARYLKNMTISNYLPTFSLFGDYSHKKDSFRVFQQNNESTNYGIKVSMPIFDINRGRNIEIKQLEYLKSKIVLKDKQKEIENAFKIFINDIEILRKREALARHDSTLYASLVAAASDGVQAGEKTSSDLKTLENSQQMSLLDAKIYAIQIQEKFLALYAKMSDEI